MQEVLPPEHHANIPEGCHRLSNRLVLLGFPCLILFALEFGPPSMRYWFHSFKGNKKTAPLPHAKEKNLAGSVVIKGGLYIFYLDMCAIYAIV